MSAPVPSTRRLAIAIGTAAASATIAVGVTAASLLGWFTPVATAPAPEAPSPVAPSPVILVPVSPQAGPGDVAVAMDVDRGIQVAREDDDRDEHREDHRDHDDEEDDDDE